MLDFYNRREPTARKEHKCFLCGKPIPAGTQYCRTSCKYDGEFSDICLHEDCQSLIDEYCRDCDENEYTHNDIYDYMYDFYCCNICDEEQRESCKEETFYCPIICNARKKRQAEVGG